MKHTPGPWRIAEVFNKTTEHEICCVESCSHDALEIVGPMLGHNEDPIYNARLIAAAPDLLEAAKQLLAGHDKNLGGMHDWFRRIETLRAAVAKAEHK